MEEGVETVKYVLGEERQAAEEICVMFYGIEKENESSRTPCDGGTTLYACALGVSAKHPKTAFFVPHSQADDVDGCLQN